MTEPSRIALAVVSASAVDTEIETMRSPTAITRARRAARVALVDREDVCAHTSTRSPVFSAGADRSMGTANTEPSASAPGIRRWPPASRRSSTASPAAIESTTTRPIGESRASSGSTAIGRDSIVRSPSVTTMPGTRSWLATATLREVPHAWRARSADPTRADTNHAHAIAARPVSSHRRRFAQSRPRVARAIAVAVVVSACRMGRARYGCRRSRRQGRRDQSADELDVAGAEGAGVDDSELDDEPDDDAPDDELDDEPRLSFL